ncbi:MAG: GHKL domain-containing protein [Oscillospiraceae bacterium]|nr:GHKL domain-containing protein [Oscillospiraceae bacterium]
MDCFDLFLDALCLAGQSVLHILFVSRLTGREPKPRHMAVYLALLCALEGLSLRYALPALPAICAEAAVLYGVSRLALKNPRPASCAAALFAVYISQLSFGAVNSAEAVLFPSIAGKPLLYPLVVLAALASLAICGGCYSIVLRFASLAEDGPYVWVLLCPGAFLLAAELYILRTAYSSAVLSQERTGTHGALLLLQAAGLAALLCTLYAYRHLRRGLQAQAEVRSLTQAAQAQKRYVAEARARYEGTRAFRHDVKNHLSVLDGLLRAGKLEEGRAYLQKLEAASAALSFPCQTGDPAVDVLLGEKLRLAQASGITAEARVVLPRPCAAGSLDLCVIFANALDNAIEACRAVQGERSLSVSGRRQGGFYMLSFENTCPDGPMPPEGTGLSNIRSAAEKYRGAVLTEKSGGRFSLHVLLNISLPEGDISGQGC